MSPEPIDELKALSPGCEVWVVANPAVSKWTRKIDWYLGFQIMKASVHEPREISPELKTILEKEEMEPVPVSTQSSSAPLMVASTGRLPTKMAVMVPYENDVADWAEKCHSVWQKLNCPLLRVFLPDTVTPKSFVSAWPAQSRGSARVEVVPESIVESV